MQRRGQKAQGAEPGLLGCSPRGQGWGPGCGQKTPQAGDLNLPLGPTLAVPLPPLLHRPGLHHGGRETSAEEEFLHHSLLCLCGGEAHGTPPAQTLKGEEALSEVAIRDSTQLCPSLLWDSGHLTYPPKPVSSSVKWA